MQASTWSQASLTCKSVFKQASLREGIGTSRNTNWSKWDFIHNTTYVNFYPYISVSLTIES